MNIGIVCTLTYWGSVLAIFGTVSYYVIREFWNYWDRTHSYVPYLASTPEAKRMTPTELTRLEKLATRYGVNIQEINYAKNYAENKKHLWEVHLSNAEERLKDAVNSQSFPWSV